jgi:hypothetical protein
MNAVSSYLKSFKEHLLPNNPEVSHIPLGDLELTPKQKILENTPAFETLFGGAAGGGKTLGGVAVCKKQGHKVLMLRRTFPELEDSIIQETLSLYGDRKYYNSQRHVWYWHTTGQRIRAGYCASRNDVLQYQSAQFDILFVDELSQWADEYVYLYLFSRVRRKKDDDGSSGRCRVIACTNPGNDGEAWIIRRWAPWLDPNHPNPAESGELRYFKRDAEGNDVECDKDDPLALSRTFIQSKLEDNPYIDEDYVKRLDMLPEPLRTQLKNGEWGAQTEDAPRQLYPTDWIEAAMERWEEPQGEPDSAAIDVARGGKDRTTLVKRYGNTVGRVDSWPGKYTKRGEDMVALVAPLLDKRTLTAIDVVNVGGSPYDIMVDNGYNVVPFNSSEKAVSHKGEPLTDRSGLLKMRNVRSAAHWKLREALEDGKIALPPDPGLKQELMAVRWSVTSQGIAIDDKKNIHKLIGRSPDKGDGVVMAWFVSAPPKRIPLSELRMG